MEYHTLSGPIQNLKAKCLVLGVREGSKLDKLYSKLFLDRFPFLKQTLNTYKNLGKAGQSIWLPNTEQHAIGSFLLIGLGKEKALKPTQYKKVLSQTLNALDNAHQTSAVFTLLDIDVESVDLSWKTHQCITHIHHARYKFNDFKSKPGLPHSLQAFGMWLESKAKEKKIYPILAQAHALEEGTSFTKNLANTPANVCTPSYLAQQAKNLAKKFPKISTAILDEKQMKSLKMNTLLSVAKGSIEPPKLITLSYQGTKKSTKPVVLVGKAVTFDTGGNSLKPAANMMGMKFDMAGGACIFGLMHTVASLKLPVNLIGVIPSVENMPGGSASRPDDIVTSMSGQTIEILNTDAEGRLILCDALTYAERYNPDVVIDIATLTGACVIALGHVATGMYSNDDKLAKALVEAGKTTHDLCWHMPLFEEYQELLKSKFADVANIGGPTAGSVTAACFLARFTKKYRWAHLDVAGTACEFKGPHAGATGRPVPLLLEYLKQNHVR